MMDSMPGVEHDNIIWMYTHPLVTRYLSGDQGYEGDEECVKA
jgi:hypothetical protein